MFTRMAFVTCFALLFLGSAAQSEEASSATENGSAAGAAVSNVESMAERELEIGRYYMSRGNHIGAINRFKVVVTRFPSSSAVDQALFRLVQVYLTIGIRMRPRRRQQCSIANFRKATGVPMRSIF
jgi:Outer membrane lipoprotein